MKQEGTGSEICTPMHIRTTLAFSLSRSDFKSETSFGFPSPKYKGKVLDFFVKPKFGLFAFFVSVFIYVVVLVVSRGFMVMYSMGRH